MSEEVWNRGDVRRHSAILDDEPMPVRSFERGQGSNSPRPPTMIERSMLSRQPTMPHMYANNGYGGYNDGYGANGYDSQPQSFSPGEFVVTPTSVNPFISQYAQSPMGSPTSSTVPHYNGAYSEPTTPQAAVTRQMSTSQLSRHNTVSDMPGHGTPGTPGPEDPHYVDLSRSSVTPFQAQQYAEISRKLNVPPPAVLGSVSEEEQFLTPPAAAYSTDVPLTAGSGTTMYAQQTGLAQHFSLPAAANANPESPFADPTMFDTSRTHPDSHKQDDNEEDTQDFEAPAGMAALTHNRIASNPPILPEITVQQRAFSPVPGTYDYAVPSSVHNTPSPFHAEFGDVSVPPPAALANRSPLATAPVHAAPEVQPREPIASAGQKRPETTYTLYDEEDAYGGI
ncbi:hypothetical protein FA95DRAFT_422128 [Auriscalpium vulgare]|uniref:Uncharacterized protein n=1 Tax=Auriscalpium vulgare TaxID=40419 RepID=A0ACB8S3W4_9AGAM|nr:hypothetical protein FA95DRAFT_422128 [Auriscalpium vulgare]